jgi:Ca2+-binding RTX toxin-like protein
MAGSKNRTHTQSGKIKFETDVLDGSVGGAESSLYDDGSTKVTVNYSAVIADVVGAAGAYEQTDNNFTATDFDIFSSGVKVSGLGAGLDVTWEREEGLAIDLEVSLWVVTLEGSINVPFSSLPTTEWNVDRAYSLSTGITLGALSMGVGAEVIAEYDDGGFVFGLGGDFGLVGIEVEKRLEDDDPSSAPDSPTVPSDPDEEFDSNENDNSSDNDNSNDNDNDGYDWVGDSDLGYGDDVGSGGGSDTGTPIDYGGTDDIGGYSIGEPVNDYTDTLNSADDDISYLYPIIVDLDGDGIEATFGQDVYFDVDGDGYLENTSWVGADDGFLVIDLNADGTRGAGDGIIDQAEELAMSLWGNNGDTDLQALKRAFDDNNDGVINKQDSIWSELRIWQDVNQNGVSDAGEVRSLSDWGITKINLGYDDGTGYGNTSNDISVGGVTLHGTASFTMDGEVVEGGVGDISLAYNEEGYRYVETDDGYVIEFENGEKLRYAVLDGDGVQNVDLDDLVLDGATGDDRNNTLTAAWHTRSVTISGGAGNDKVFGGNNDDLLSGDAGADDIRGHGGNDTLYVDADDLSNGFVSGNEGVDTLIVTGNTGVNVTLIDHNVEAVYGGGGADILSGLGSSDDLPIYGGKGADTILGGLGNDTLSGDDGADVIKGGNGDDTILGGAGLDTLNGGNGDDLILGGTHADVIDGGNGDDTLIGGGGIDTLLGGNGDDSVDGGDGADILDGGLGDDNLYGGNGADHLYYWQGDDLLVGGNGNDTFYLQQDDSENPHWGWAIAQGGKGIDTFEIGFNFSGYSHVSYKHVGGNQWQLILQNNANEKVVVDLQDIEILRFKDGTEVTLSTDTSLDSSDDYIRKNPNAYLGDGASWNDGSGVWSGWTGNDVSSDSWADAAHTYYGGTGNDQIDGAQGADTMSGGAGDDFILGGVDNDIINGNSGSDTLLGEDGDDEIYGGAGSDQIWGDSGDSEAAIGGKDTLYGGGGADTLSGERGDDELYGESGNDTLYGGRGVDLLEGGIGSDTLYGNEGADKLFGNEGSDTLDGGDGNDKLFGGAGFDQLSGGEGDDTLDGGDEDDWLFGGNGTDTLKGGNGLDVLNGGAGGDALDGGLGLLDVANYEGSGAGVTVNLKTDTAFGGHAQNDTLINIESIYGSDHNDTLTGDDLDNTLEGGKGADTLVGGDGHDSIDGGGGYDTIYGGAGDDRVWGGNGRDTVSLGHGDDAFYDNDQDDEHGDDTVDAGDGDDEIYGGGGNDTFRGDAGDDYIEGGEGNDTLSGGEGADVLHGNQGSDWISGNAGVDSISGGNGEDTIYAGAGDDRVWGGYGSDTVNLGNGDDVFYDNDQDDGDDIVFGGSGADIIYTGGGKDTLTGDGGNDTFVFADIASGNNTITDFSLTDDTLKFDGFSMSDLSFSSTGSGVRVTWDDGSVKLDDITLSSVDDINFAFV